MREPASPLRARGAPLPPPGARARPRNPAAPHRVCPVCAAVTSFVRRILSFSIAPTDGFPAVWEFEVSGHAFLWHQVRCMVAVLFLVGEGRESPAVVSWLLDTAATPRRPLYDMAPDAPLLLHEIGYEGMVWPPSDAAALDEVWGRELESSLLAAATSHTKRRSLGTAGLARGGGSAPGVQGGGRPATYVPLRERRTADAVEAKAGRFNSSARRARHYPRHLTAEEQAGGAGEAATRAGTKL